MNTNSYIEAEVHYDDGSTDQPPLLRQSVLSGQEKYFQEADTELSYKILSAQTEMIRFGLTSPIIF